MKKLLAGAAIATMMFAAAGFAYSARPAAVSPGQFRALQTRVAKLEKATGALAAYDVNCLFHWQGVARFGQPPSNGYVYDNDNNPDNGQFLASALDVTDAGEAPSAYFVSTQDTTCVQPSGLALRRILLSLGDAAGQSSSAGRIGLRNAPTPYGSK